MATCLELTKHSAPRPRKARAAYGRALYPEYATKAARLATFTNWPKPKVIEPDELGSAGFFYLNDSDRVCCFVCGCVVYNWDLEACPKNEHKDWSPHCEYARLLLENPEALIEVATLPAVRAVAALDFPYDDIITAYEQLQHSGCRSPSAADLLEQIWANQRSKPAATPNGAGGQPWANQRPKPAAALSGSGVNLWANQRSKLAKPLSGSENLDDSEEEDLYSAGACAFPPHDDETEDGEDGEDEEDDDEEDVEYVIEIDIKKARENANLRRQIERLERIGTCQVCMAAKANVANLPCGHLATCETCVYKYKKCRICKTLIQGIVKTFMT